MHYATRRKKKRKLKVRKHHDLVIFGLIIVYVGILGLAFNFLLSPRVINADNLLSEERYRTSELFQFVEKMQAKVTREAYLKELSPTLRIMVEVADEYGIKPEHLVAISLVESNLCRVLRGDGGISRGCFHINIKANPDALTFVGNIRQDSQWVAKKLLLYGYKKGKITQSFYKYNCPACRSDKYSYAAKVLGQVQRAKLLLKK